MSYNTFKYDTSFKKYLEAQRHRCRSGRQNKESYELTSLYSELKATYDLINDEINLNKYDRPISILDIGCGLGYIDIVIYNELKLKPHLFLFDSESTFEYEKGDGKKNKKFYNDLSFTREFLLINGINLNKINLLNAEVSDELLKIDNKSLDIIISLFSWFWHYPNINYLKHSHRMLSDSGYLIFNFKCRTKEEEENKVLYVKDLLLGYFKIRKHILLDGEILFITEKIND